MLDEPYMISLLSGCDVLSARLLLREDNVGESLSFRKIGLSIGRLAAVIPRDASMIAIYMVRPTYAVCS